MILKNTSTKGRCSLLLFPVIALVLAFLALLLHSYPLSSQMLYKLCCSALLSLDLVEFFCVFVYTSTCNWGPIPNLYF